MVNFRFLKEKQCKLCSKDYIPFDAEFPFSDNSHCSKDCRDKAKAYTRTRFKNKLNDGGYRKK